MRWEVSIPAAMGRASASTVTVDGENWLGALQNGLVAAGDEAPLGTSFDCTILEDQSVRVTDFARSCVYLLRPLVEGGDATASAPPKAKKSPSIPPAPAIRSSAAPTPAPRGRASMGPTPPAATRPAPMPTPAPAIRSAPPLPAPVPVPPPVVPLMFAPTAAAVLAAQKHALGFPTDVAPMSRPSDAPAASAPTPAPDAPEPLPTYEIFARRDENPDAGNPLTYRDRLFAVPPATLAADAVRLLQHYFAELQMEIAGHGPGKFINLAVFDHPFRGRPERPAIAALSWKDWRGADPEITFPAAAPPDKSLTPARGTPSPERGITPVDRRRRSSGELPAPDLGPDDRLVEVFEAMQDLFQLTTQRDAATFALDLALEKIPCEAGSTVLNDLDRGDLFFAAVRGPASEHLEGVRLEQGKGIIGAAALSLQPISIDDVASDTRFFPDFDRMTGFETRTVLCAPLDYDGRAVGAIELLNKKDGRPFTQSDINLLSYIAENLSNFVATSLPEVDEPRAPDRGKPRR